MKSYTKAYLKHFGYDIADFIPCESCGAKATDIHHLVPRSRNRALLNDITNLTAVCRTCHTRAESNAQFNAELKTKHLLKLEAHGQHSITT